MGLFGTLKAKMDGGVQVHVQAPGSVPANEVIPVTVTLTADTPRTVNAVKAEIKAQAREEGFTMGGGRGVGMQEGTTTYQTVAQVESREPFTIEPGETKTLNLQLYLNGEAGGASSMNPGAGTGGLGGMLQTVAQMAQNFDHVNYLYSVHASADVQDVHLSPSDKQPIQILPPAETAAAAQPTTFAANTPAQPEPAVVPLAPTPPAAQSPQAGPTEQMPGQ